MKSAAFLIVPVHWMNPLVHLAYYLMIRDMEMSCDEKVISSMPVSRKEYASSFLQIERPSSKCLSAELLFAGECEEAHSSRAFLSSKFFA